MVSATFKRAIYRSRNIYTYLCKDIYIYDFSNVLYLSWYSLYWLFNVQSLQRQFSKHAVFSPHSTPLPMVSLYTCRALWTSYVSMLCGHVWWPAVSTADFASCFRDQEFLLRASEFNENRQRLWENMKSPRPGLAETQEGESEYTTQLHFIQYVSILYIFGTETAASRIPFVTT